MNMSAKAYRGIVLAALLLVLGGVNYAVWQRERLLAEGQVVLLELAPVDPRSLMQGDFMRLNFRLPAEATREFEPLRGARRPLVVARRDERGVATLVRIDNGAPMQADLSAGIRDVAFAEACYRSARDRAWVDLPAIGH